MVPRKRVLLAKFILPTTARGNLEEPINEPVAWIWWLHREIQGQKVSRQRVDSSSGKSVGSYAKVYPNQRTPEEKAEPPLKNPPINWDALKQEGPAAEFRTKMDKFLQQENLTLEKAVRKMAESGKETCGLKEKTNLKPWLEQHTSEISAFQERIKKLTEDLNAGNLTARETRKETRAAFKKKKTEWEESWWLTLVQEIKSAEGSGDTRRMYQTLRKIGIKDLRVIEEEHFTADEKRAHLMAVSERRYERTAEEIRETAEMIPYRNDITTTQAGEKLASNVSFEEFYHELQKIKDNSPGVDGVRLIALKILSGGAQERPYNCLIDLLNTPADRWPAITREGWIVPLFKKGKKDDLNNYKGVCLLPLASRLIARILATRLREWSEAIGVLGETQSGFRKGRSTADATQIIIRTDEEVRRVYGRNHEEEGPGATLLDITKAYPRVSKPLLWELLVKLGVPGSTREYILPHKGQRRYERILDTLPRTQRRVRDLAHIVQCLPLRGNAWRNRSQKRGSRKQRKTVWSEMELAPGKQLTTHKHEEGSQKLGKRKLRSFRNRFRWRYNADWMDRRAEDRKGDREKQAVAFWRKMPWWQRGKHSFRERRSDTDQNVGYKNWLKGGHWSTPEARLHGLEQTSPLVLAIQPHEENESSNCPSSGWVNSSFRQQHETMGHDEHKKTTEHGW